MNNEHKIHSSWKSNMNTVTQRKQVVFALCNKKTIALSQEFTYIHERSNELINIKQFIRFMYHACILRADYGLCFDAEFK